jgi:hypothetical protein
MAQNELNPSFAEDPAVQSSICARCGKIAEIHLSLLGDASRGGEIVCLACAEVLLSDLRKQRAEHPVTRLPAFANPSLGHTSLLHSDVADDVESGIIFWEGHGWSSDGPFAGA